MERSSLEVSQNSTGEILRDVLAQKMSRNPSFSLRAFARSLGVSHTYLSLVLNGKKSLSLRKVIQFAEILNLEERESAAFIRAGTAEARGRAAEKVRASASRKKPVTETCEDFFALEVDRFRILSDWYHLPLLELTYTKDFKSDPAWIAKRLAISVDQARNAIDRLKRMGLLMECGGKLSKTNSRLSVLPKGFEKPIRDFHRQMIAKASESMELEEPEDYAARDITGASFAIDPAKLPEAKRRITAFRRSMIKFLTEGESSEVYQLNIQFFPITSRRFQRANHSRKGVVVKRGVK
jgi:uncharacterized protein (TIGR02147 family)